MTRKSLYPVIVRSSVSLSLHNVRWLIDRARIYREKTAFVENSRSLSGFIITKQYTYSTSLISVDCDCISWISEVWGSVWDNLPLKCQRLIWVLHLAEKTWRGSSSRVRPWFQYLIWNFRLCSYKRPSSHVGIKRGKWFTQPGHENRIKMRQLVRRTVLFLTNLCQGMNHLWYFVLRRPLQCWRLPQAEGLNLGAPRSPLLGRIWALEALLMCTLAVKPVSCTGESDE